LIKGSPRNWLNTYYLLKHGLNEDNKIFTHLTIEEKLLLHKALSSQRRKLICVEIGSFLGASTCFIANAISSKSSLYCIDTWGNHAMKYCEKDNEKERNTKPEFDKNTAKYKYKIITFQEWSDKAIALLRKKVKQVDFIFFDGDHNYEPVKSDWLLYSPLLKPGSLVAFHDTGWADGVKKVIANYVSKKAVLVASEPNLQIYRIKK
jgi:predicted O-methyltransferase YrrM